MIIVADGGSTKVDWALIQSGELTKRIRTEGANPYFRSYEEIVLELREVLLPQVKDAQVESVHFFGAGCANEEKCAVVRKAISDSLQVQTVEVESDLLGAAKGLCGHDEGIACILGTGSNSGYYDGTNIVENVSPLGYILGDEGSGAVLGRLFIGACLKNQLSPDIKQAFLDETGLTVPDIIERVYRGTLLNRFLASFSPFIRNYLHEPVIYNMVAANFEDFFRRNVLQYNYLCHKIYFTGSVAFHFQQVLQEVAGKLHLTIEKIVPSPLDGLIANYIQELNSEIVM